MLDGLHVDPGRAAAIGTALLGCGDPLGLTFLAQVGLELGKDAEHVEECFAGPDWCCEELLERDDVACPVLSGPFLCLGDLSLSHEFQLIRRSGSSADTSHTRSLSRQSKVSCSTPFTTAAMWSPASRSTRQFGPANSTAWSRLMEGRTMSANRRRNVYSARAAIQRPSCALLLFFGFGFVDHRA